MSSPADLVARLHGLIDELAALDVESLDGGELQSLMVAVEAERNRLTVAAGRVAHTWEQRGGWRADGSLRASGAMARDTRGYSRTAARDLRRGRLLERLPHTRTAVLAGRLSIDHVDLFLTYATPARFELFLEHEQMLVDQCAGCALFDDARRIVQYWAHLADDLLGLEPHLPEPSTLTRSRSATTGEMILRGVLDPVDAEIVDNELRRLMRQLRLDDTAAGVTRTPAQLRAAALVRMAARSVNATRVTARPLFQVIVGDETARHLCELASGHVLRAEQLLPHVDTATMEVFLFDGPTAVIAKTHRRTFTGALRRAILIRDRRCQHRSVCPTPDVDCDVDHRTPAARGGPTSQFNGRAQCAPHNRNPDLHDVDPHDHDPHDQDAASPERRLEYLDAVRCRLRWTLQRELEEEDRARALTLRRVDELLAGRR